jgi:inosine-uridine nucleoside N-ribohydrolase
VIRIAAVAAAVLVAAALFTLALPIEGWRTGDQGLALLDSVPEAATPPFPRRVWIDTDAACGHSRRTDPDDCFAIALLLRSPEIDVVGISTVAGNASREVVDATMGALLSQHGFPVPRTTELKVALEQGPLTILALGPLTNIATVLSERPDLAKHVARLIAVMARRPGHIFHPAEGAGGGMLFGHGPVFRDFNFALDPDAAAQVLAMKLPMSFIPYDAARGIELTAADLDRMETSCGGSSSSRDLARLLAQRYRPRWLLSLRSARRGLRRRAVMASVHAGARLGRRGRQAVPALGAQGVAGAT